MKSLPEFLNVEFSVAETSDEALWICLICGHVGCSRYHQGHAFEHYRETHHCYAMQLGNNRVWDYVGDNFVHRLLQDKDGKMVEGGQTATKGEGPGVDDKVDSVQLEFTYLLTSQLETQRQYFEERLNRIEEHATMEISELKTQLNQISEENIELKNKFGTIVREKQSLEKRLQNSTTKLTQLQTELNEEKDLRKCLELNQSSWQAKYKVLQDEMTEYKSSKETEVVDLREQLRDVMFFLEAQKQIENSADKDEIAAGRIVIASNSNESKSKKKTHKTH